MWVATKYSWLYLGLWVLNYLLRKANTTIIKSSRHNKFQFKYVVDIINFNLNISRNAKGILRHTVRQAIQINVQ